MVEHYQINGEYYLWPTPGGAFYATKSTADDALRLFLLRLLGMQRTAILNEDTLLQFGRFADVETGLETLYAAQQSGFLQGEDQSRVLPEGDWLEEITTRIGTLSSEAKAVLADGDGFNLASSGYSNDTAEELAAAAADIWTLHERRMPRIENELQSGINAWGLVDAAGNSQLGFWPLYLGDKPLMLILGGVPYLNQESFTEVAWLLANRYAAK